jgi:hypothetical protein
MINYQTKCSILGDLWSNYRFDEDFEQFIDYNDLGLPLAYFLAEGLVTEITPEGQLFVNESFNLFIAALEIKEEEIKDDMSLNDLLKLAEDKLK